MKQLTKLAFVVSHPIQHFCPLFRATAETGKVAVRVFFASTAGATQYFDKDFAKTISWQSDILSGYDHEFLPGAASVSVSEGSISNPDLEKRLSAFDPDVIQVFGFWHGISRQAIAWAKSHGRKVLVLADSELRSERRLATRLRKLLTVPWFLNQVDGILTIGDCNEAYYVHHGAALAKLHRCPCPIDDQMLRRAMQDRTEIRRELRTRMGVEPNDILAIVVGKLTKRKAPEHAIQALAMTTRHLSRSSRLHLLFAGDGPEFGTLVQMSKAIAPNIVHFPGFVNVDVLPSYLVSSDFMVHPSSADPHPLATSEAVFCGLPVIASDRVGSIGPSDDIRLGVNGFEYTFGDIDALAGNMRALTCDHELRKRMSEASVAIGKDRGLPASVSGILHAVDAVLDPAGIRNSYEPQNRHFAFKKTGDG